MKIAITGAAGLLGWHSAARLHAQNCAATYRKETQPYELSLIDHAIFDDDSALAASLADCDAILHWAGVNRGEEAYVEAANPAIAEQLVSACKSAGVAPHIVYANSTHAAHDSFYGRSKRIAGEILQAFAGEKFTNLILPHIFGECARPYYNNVTATLIDQLWQGEQSKINAEAQVELLHSGEAAQIAIDAALAGTPGDIRPAGRQMHVSDLYEKLQHLHNMYQQNIFPDLSDPFDLALFNSYRTGGFPTHYPMKMKVNADHRGILFESAKGGNASHTFLSTTLPGQQRGDHFHYDLVERFLVVHGNAKLQIRKVLTDKVYEFEVSGDEPVAIDQLPFHTHNIINDSDDTVVTFFWSHRMFDPEHPDTYADPV